MSFSLKDAVAYLRCPRTGATLEIEGANLATADGSRYPIVDGIPDLTIQDPHRRAEADYDSVAGLGYNAWIFNPVTMSFTWGLGVLKVPVLLRPSRELRPGVFLEVPCGTGIFTARAYRQNPQTRILAVDLSMGMLRAARSRARRLGVDNAVFIRADVVRLPIADGSLDGCLSLAGFHAFPDAKTAAAEVARVLKPGAPISASIACSGVRRLSDLMIEHVMKPGGYFNQALPADAYRAYLEQGGFSNVRFEMAGAVAIVRGVRA